jgi:hypothetical protein
VPDINAALKRIEDLVGKTVVPRAETPNMVTFAQFRDPFGHLFGLLEPYDAEVTSVSARKKGWNGVRLRPRASGTGGSG